MDSSGIVNQTTGFVQQVGRNIPTLISSSDCRCVGVLMRPPVVDDTPYSVRAFTIAEQGSMFVFVGVAPANPDGDNDEIENPVFFPVSNLAQGRFTEVIKVPGNTPGYEDRPLAFGIAISNTKNNNVLSCVLSVQNLAMTAPQFAASMS